MPPITELTTVEGIVVQLRRKTPGTKSEVPRQQIAGTVTRAGNPVPMGWVALWEHANRERNLNSASIQRGRTVPQGGWVYKKALIDGDGTFAIDVPFQGDWYVVVEEPNEAPTVVGPLKIELNEKRQLDITRTKGGTVSGRVRNVPKDLNGYLWVVAFGRTVVRVETRVAPDGSFRLERIPPGEYGLKVGHNAYQDAEVPRPFPKELWNIPATPWKRATVVTVEAGRETSGIELELPES